MKVLFTSLILVTLGMNTATAETLQDCIDTADNSQRLACYDRIFGHTKSSNSVVSDSYNNSNSTPTYGNPEDTFGAERLNKKETDRADEISGVAKGTYKMIKKGTEITLQNGQVWEVTDSRSFVLNKTDPALSIEKGIFRAYYLKFSGYNTRLKVKRIK